MPDKAVMEEHPDRVGQIMSKRYIALDADNTADEAIEFFRSYSSDDDNAIYYIYVVDGDEKLLGVISLRELLKASPDEALRNIMTRNVILTHIDEDPEDTAGLIAEHDLLALPVIDDNGVLRGIARVDDLMDVVEEEVSEDMYRLAGLTFSEEQMSRSTAILESPLQVILRLRLPWLLIALAGGMLAGVVIDSYEATLEAVIILAFFIPAIMDMGGNVGTQSSTIFVRGLALGHITKKNARHHVVKEAAVGLSIGVVVGLISSVSAYIWAMYFWSGPSGATGSDVAFEIALVIFISMVVVCVIASLVGYVIPFISHLLGFDPAAVSDPLVTTIKDVTALLVYFGLATMLLAELI